MRSGNAAGLARAVQASRGHVLESYAEYWQLRHRFEERSAEEIRDFLTRRDGSYIAERLRADWLKVLAKKGAWDLFRDERPKLAIEDEEVACLGLLQRFNAGDTSVLAEVRPVWRTPRELPEGCAPLADQLLRSGDYGIAQIWERFRVLADAGQVKIGRAHV